MDSLDIAVMTRNVSLASSMYDAVVEVRKEQMSSLLSRRARVTTCQLSKGNAA